MRWMRVLTLALSLSLKCCTSLARVMAVYSEGRLRRLEASMAAGLAYSVSRIRFI